MGVFVQFDMSERILYRCNLRYYRCKSLISLNYNQMLVLLCLKKDTRDNAEGWVSFVRGVRRKIFSSLGGLAKHLGRYSAGRLCWTRNQC